MGFRNTVPLGDVQARSGCITAPYPKWHATRVSPLRQGANNTVPIASVKCQKLTLDHISVASGVVCSPSVVDTGKREWSLRPFKYGSRTRFTNKQSGLGGALGAPSLSPSPIHAEYWHRCLRLGYNSEVLYPNLRQWGQYSRYSMSIQYYSQRMNI